MSGDTGKCYFVVEARLERNGSIYWDPANSFPEGHWQESLNVFGEVTVLARARASSEVAPIRLRIPPGVGVGEFPYYIGPLEASRKAWHLFWTARRWARQRGIFILRGPGILSLLVWLWLRRYRKPYGVELLGDIGQVFRVINYPPRRIWGRVFERLWRTICGNAAIVAYMSRSLESAYPAGRAAAVYVVSDVRLGDSAFTGPRTFSTKLQPLRVIHVGTMEQNYKGQMFLLEALAICQRAGVSLQATLVGDGRLRPKFERLSEKLGMRDYVVFCGIVPWGEPLFAKLDASDLFVLCSLTEGLGKALLEAMARGLPAIGTAVGGIRELLDARVLVRPGDAQHLANKIMELAASPARLTELSAANYRTALDYKDTILSQRRLEYYNAARARLGGSAGEDGS